VHVEDVSDERHGVQQHAATHHCIPFEIDRTHEFELILGKIHCFIVLDQRNAREGDGRRYDIGQREAERSPPCRKPEFVDTPRDPEHQCAGDQYNQRTGRPRDDAAEEGQREIVAAHTIPIRSWNIPNNTSPALRSL